LRVRSAGGTPVGGETQNDETAFRLTDQVSQHGAGRSYRVLHSLPVPSRPRRRPFRHLGYRCGWTGDNWPAVEAFCGSGIDRREDDTIWLATVHGPERCDVGDWIIEGVEDFYPNRHNVFLAIYQGPESSS
jgi:hypothetical protein